MPPAQKRACDQCNYRRVRCNKVQPQCDRCITSQLSCSWQKQPKPRAGERIKALREVSNNASNNSNTGAAAAAVPEGGNGDAPANTGNGTGSRVSSDATGNNNGSPHLFNNAQLPPLPSHHDAVDHHHFNGTGAPSLTTWHGLPNQHQPQSSLTDHARPSTGTTHILPHHSHSHSHSHHPGGSFSGAPPPIHHHSSGSFGGAQGVDLTSSFTYDPHAHAQHPRHAHHQHVHPSLPALQHSAGTSSLHSTGGGGGPPSAGPSAANTASTSSSGLLFDFSNPSHQPSSHHHDPFLGGGSGQMHADGGLDGHNGEGIMMHDYYMPPIPDLSTLESWPFWLAEATTPSPGSVSNPSQGISANSAGPTTSSALPVLGGNPSGPDSVGSSGFGIGNTGSNTNNNNGQHNATASTSQSNNNSNTTSSLPGLTSSHPEFVESLLSDTQLIPSIALFFERLHPIVPIFTRSWLLDRIDREEHHRQPRFAAMLLALTAQTLLQAARPSERASRPERVRQARLALEESARVNASAYIGARVSLDEVMTAFYSFSCLFVLHEQDAAAYRLREAVTLAQLLKLHLPEAYAPLEPAERQRRLRMYWILCITERAYVLQHGDNIGFRGRPSENMAAVVDSIGPEALEDFPHKQLRLFDGVDEIVADCWHRRCSPGQCTRFTREHALRLHAALDLSLQDTPAPSSYSSRKASALQREQIQKTDSVLTLQWLHVQVWNICLTHGLLAPSDAEAPLRPSYVLECARQAYLYFTSVDAPSKEAHGVGLLEKMYDIGQALILALQVVVSPVVGGGSQQGGDCNPNAVLAMLDQFIVSLGESSEDGKALSERLNAQKYHPQVSAVR